MSIAKRSLWENRFNCYTKKDNIIDESFYRVIVNSEGKLMMNDHYGVTHTIFTSPDGSVALAKQT